MAVNFPSMAAKRKAEVAWQNDLIHGSGKVRFGSGAIGETGVSWAARTESTDGKTSPEELLAAAHASCFAMAFSNGLAKNNTPPSTLDVTAVCTFDKVGDGWKVTTMELSVRGVVPSIENQEFQKIAMAAKEGCPISNAIRNNVKVTLNASLS